MSISSGTSVVKPRPDRQIPAGAIDTHAHFYPAFYLDALEDAGVSARQTDIARGMRADSTAEDIKYRLEWADKAGVATQVISVSPQAPAVADAHQARTLAEMINEHYLSICTDYPHRFLAYAALPLPHIDAALAEIDRVRRQDFVGFTINTFLPGGKSNFTAEFDPVWEALDEIGAVVNIHPTGQGLCAPAITDFDLHWVNGAPVEDATAVLQLLKAGINVRYPNITFHVAHLGGDLAFMAQRLEDNFTDWDAFPASPQASLQSMYFDAANFHEPALRAALDTYGSTQVLSGSDFPYFQQNKYVRAFDYIRTADITEHDKASVLRRNACALYGCN